MEHRCLFGCPKKIINILFYELDLGDGINNSMDLTNVTTREQMVFCEETRFAFRTNLDETTYTDRIIDMI